MLFANSVPARVVCDQCADVEAGVGAVINATNMRLLNTWFLMDQAKDNFA